MQQQQEEQQQRQSLVPHHKPAAAEASLVLHKQSQHRLIYWPNCGDQLQLQIGVGVQHSRKGEEEEPLRQLGAAAGKRWRHCTKSKWAPTGSCLAAWTSASAAGRHASKPAAPLSLGGHRRVCQCQCQSGQLGLGARTVADSDFESEFASWKLLQLWLQLICCGLCASDRPIPISDFDQRTPPIRA